MIDSVAFWLQRAADQFGDAWAYIDRHHRCSYRQLLEQTARLAAKLVDSGVRPGDRCCFVPSSNAATLRLYWAVWGVGAVACPLSPRLPRAARQLLGEQVAARFLLDQREVIRLVEESRGTRGAAPWQPAQDERPATIVFSSGTTAAPKAVVHTLAAHWSSARGAQANMRLGSSDRWLWSLPACHVSGLSILFRCALAGAAVVGCEPPADPAESLSVHAISHLSVVPTQLHRLLSGDPAASRSLRAVLLGGSVLPPRLIRQARAAGWPVRTTYGLTEMASQVTATPAEAPDDKQTTAGRLLPERELLISRDGEILVRGGPLCLGYCRAEQIEPAVDGDGWLHTGDVGCLDTDGYLTVTGRRDNMFISGGENIHPEEIERWLLEIEGVRQAIVVPVPDAEFGQRPAAFVDLSRGDAATLRDALRSVLPDFKIPRAFFDWPHEALAGESSLKPGRRFFRGMAEHYPTPPRSRTCP
jgi:O-succinylbenzoic acid--CoA ligase